MALLAVDDLNYRIIFLLDLEEMLDLMPVNKRSEALVKNTLVYQDLITLRGMKFKYPFHSESNIILYYRHGLIHILQQYRYYLYRGLYWAASSGHINVL